MVATCSNQNHEIVTHITCQDPSQWKWLYSLLEKLPLIEDQIVRAPIQELVIGHPHHWY